MGGMSTNRGPVRKSSAPVRVRPLAGGKEPDGGLVRVLGALLGPEATGRGASFWGCLVDVVSVVPAHGLSRTRCRVCSLGVRVVGVTGLLFGNCIVDASILWIGAFGFRFALAISYDLNLARMPSGVWFLVLSIVDRAHVNVDHVCGQVFKGARWMPWHWEPMKDVGICDKPGGVDNRTLRPGFPNGETPCGIMPHDRQLNT
jgi:hypothetical protein